MSMMDKDKEKAACTPVIGVAGEQPSFMYNKNNYSRFRGVWQFASHRGSNIV